MKHFLMIAAVSTLITGALFAQSAPAIQPNDPNTVNARRESQQDRIANGVATGQLTAGETSNLESREANLNREMNDDRQDKSGKVTVSELEQVNEQQARLNKSIADKHNAEQQNYKGEVGARQENQQDHADHAANSGRFADSELAQVNREENRTSHQFHREKHNNVHQPK